MHHPELCTEEGHLNTQNMREIIRDEEQLYEQSEIFKLFSHSREHFKDLNADDTPQIARVVSLDGYRSAFAYYVAYEQTHLSSKS